MTTAFYWYQEDIFKTRSMGAFLMLVGSAAVGFLLWYKRERSTHEINKAPLSAVALSCYERVPLWMLGVVLCP